MEDFWQALACTECMTAPDQMVSSPGINPAAPSVANGMVSVDFCREFPYTLESKKA